MKLWPQLFAPSLSSFLQSKIGNRKLVLNPSTALRINSCEGSCVTCSFSFCDSPSRLTFVFGFRIFDFGLFRNRKSKIGNLKSCLTSLPETPSRVRARTACRPRSWTAPPALRNSPRPSADRQPPRPHELLLRVLGID